MCAPFLSCASVYIVLGSNPDTSIDIEEVVNSTRSIDISSAGVRIGFGDTVNSKINAFVAGGGYCYVS